VDGLKKEDIDDRPGSLIPQGVNSESHVRKFGFECEQGSLFGFQRADRIQIAAGLRDIGPKIDGAKTTALYAPLFTMACATWTSLSCSDWLNTQAA